VRIRKIELENLNSLRGKQSIDFTVAPLENAGIIAITGETGAGKSTILDSILLALYGSTPRKHQGEVVTYGMRDAWAEVEFEARNEIYRSRWEVKLSRGIDPKQQTPNVTLMQLKDQTWETIGAGSKHLYGNTGLVSEITGLNIDQFCKTVILPQNEIAAFLKSKGPERADILEKLTSTEIYGQISTAAYEKFDQHRKALEHLELRRNELRIPTELEIEDWRKENDALNLRLTEIKTDRKSIADALAWYQQDQQISAQISTQNQELERLAIAHAAIEQDRLRLEQHRLAAPFVPQIEHWKEEKLSAERLLTELNKTIEGEKDVLAKLEQHKSRLIELNQSLEHHQAKYAEWKPILKHVFRLDEQIALSKTQVVPLLSEIEQYNLRINQNDGALVAQTKLSKELNDKILVTTDWLEKNTHLEKIDGDRARLEQVLEAIKEQKQLSQVGNKQLESLERSLSKTRADRVKKEENTQKLARELIRIQTELDQAFEQLATSPETLNQTIEDLHAQIFAYRQILEQQKRYHATLTQISSLREENSHLLLESDAIHKELLNLLDQKSVYEQEMHLRKAVQEQQLWLNKIAAEREKLEQGKPCPLCGSLDHPFERHVPQLLELTKTDFEKAEQAYQKIESRIADLQMEALRIHRRIGEVIEEGDQTEYRAVHRLLMQSSEEEETLRSLLETLPAEHGKAFDGIDQLNIEHAEARLKTYLAMRENFDIVQRKLEVIRKEEAVDQNQLTGLRADEVHLEQQLFSQRATVNEILQKIEKDNTIIEALIKPYGFDFKPGEAVGIAEIDRLKDKYDRGKKALTEFENDKIECTQAIKHLTQKKQDLINDKALKDKQLEAEKEILSSLEAERIALIGNRDGHEFEQEIQAEIKQAQDAIQALMTEFQVLEKQASALAGSKEIQRKAAETSHQKLLSMQQMLMNEIEKLGLDSIEALSALVLPIERVSEIKTAIENLTRQEHTAKAKLEEQEIALNKHREQTPIISLDVVQSQNTQFDAEEEMVQRQIGSIQQKFEDFKRITIEAAGWLDQIAQETMLLERWQVINAIIGEKNGNKFRRFAQGITLDNLIYHANQHLKRLYGRYLISRQAGDDLELEIIDTFQSDHKRSAKSLSGGETFLISLALALGLSDLAGQKTRIQSVFIDEGFGSLDATTLETAMEALENLQAEGVTISIISHIPALHERIGTRIAIQKVGNGYSTVGIELG
jgi:DNA repair protein SbcC/Rad50